jgi:uncharacterized protein DUF4337
MEDPERPTEFLEEQILEEQIEHHAPHSNRDRTAWVAVTTAILAAFAAIGSLLSNSRSEHLFRKHEAFSWAVTGFQIGISLSAISLLTKRRKFWLFGLVFGAAGLFLLIFGLLR